MGLVDGFLQARGGHAHAGWHRHHRHDHRLHRRLLLQDRPSLPKDPHLEYVRQELDRWDQVTQDQRRRIAALITRTREPEVARRERGPRQPLRRLVPPPRPDLKGADARADPRRKPPPCRMSRSEPLPTPTPEAPVGSPGHVSGNDPARAHSHERAGVREGEAWTSTSPAPTLK